MNELENAIDRIAKQIPNGELLAATGMVMFMTAAADLIEAQAQEIERLRNPWQPIETAPKDETQMLLWRDKVYFRGWFTPGPIDGATHWMPMPEPPQ